MEVRQQIALIVEKEPGLTSDEIFLTMDCAESLSGPSAVLRHLRVMPERVHEIAGRWYPGAGEQAMEAGGPDSADPVEAIDFARDDLEDKDLMDLERGLRHALRGRRLIAEVGLDSRLHERLTDVVEDSMPRLGVSGPWKSPASTHDIRRARKSERNAFVRTHTAGYCSSPPATTWRSIRPTRRSGPIRTLGLPIRTTSTGPTPPTATWPRRVHRAWTTNLVNQPQPA